ncbi:hypothetical protein C1645_746529 [Glomus cerebriforme]|uniref:F-box domain-containing protein n=1 Tax=Glomus cerebriforme TaxID=658196 RepID=A0A397TS18_9GLOM|nr:hypothetical protein C1645_746529 [Glomus cerebriforme]
MKQIYSLKDLDLLTKSTPNINFVSYPGAKFFFCQLSQICHNIQSLNITFGEEISDGIADLISGQQNLKYLKINERHDCEDLTNIIPLLSKLPNTLIKLKLCNGYHIPLSFISKFTNLQELLISIEYDASEDFIHHPFNDFKELQYVTFSQLRILEFPYSSPKCEYLIKFLEINGKYLKEFQAIDCENSLNLSISKFCPNLKSLCTQFMNNEMETAKLIFNNCKQLENIEIWCSDSLLNEKILLNTIAEFSPKNLCGLTYARNIMPELSTNVLEFFFISWANRVVEKFDIISY